VSNSRHHRAFCPCNRHRFISRKAVEGGSLLFSCYAPSITSHYHHCQHTQHDEATLCSACLKPSSSHCRRCFFIFCYALPRQASSTSSRPERQRTWAVPASKQSHAAASGQFIVHTSPKNLLKFQLVILSLQREIQ